ncbi:nucleoside recognition domain-containing protein [Chitinophaga nivalis]|uniref:Spore maturation protein n=1 Tax=Chitinophaga nivalis TaxID=2991709 RepID=A0ABT3ILN9_9BACT|nr:spore maturation protein [Chitinophaga nivalis]MCW3465425.1 spore maturation protein [Chitinophaga nivalis]MCW3484883.1 spore maturation protein [Chitinophaga nivalis]
MALNYVWLGFFLIAFVVAVFKSVFLHDTAIFGQIMNGMLTSAKTGAEISLGLAGVMTLWLGIMRIGEVAGMINRFSRLVNPFFSKLFPQVPKGHPAMGSMMMNFSASMLGLDNAATPMGLKAMKELQEINPHPEMASNPQIMFLVLNTAGVILIPTSVIALRMAAGAANPADIFIPTLISTFVAFIIGMFTVSLYQRINLFKLPVLVFLAGFVAVVTALWFWVRQMPAAEIGPKTASLGGFIIFGIVVTFLVAGMVKKINVYDAFIEGAKEGFQVSVRIIPYLVGMLVAISVFRTTGCMDYIINAIAALFAAVGFNTDFVPVLPVAFMKPLSGGGARGLMIEVMNQYGADSFQGKLASVIQGTTETTFYVLAVYFGSVNIKLTRYALAAGLIADFCGMLAAILLGYLFFH